MSLGLVIWRSFDRVRDEARSEARGGASGDRAVIALIFEAAALTSCQRGTCRQTSDGVSLGVSGMGAWLS
jgi:hypothetical protein